MASQHIQASESPKPYLSRNQQDLLLAALHSQASSNRNGDHSTIRGDLSNAIESSNITSPTMAMNETQDLFISPQTTDMDNYDFTPDLDYLDGDTSFDFDNADLGGEMIGALPGSGLDKHDKSEKRKSPDDAGTPEEGDAKRQETQEGEKTAKKPGRKPLTSEPTTKRKAQNRAAQRAFRERKEKHVKDLETQVADLTKASEADKHENGLLKAQIQRLQVELKEYRKRLSLNGSGSNRSPPANVSSGQHRSSSNNPSYSSNFHFDFPKFGALPGSQIFNQQKFSANSSPSNSTRDSATPSTTTNSPSVASRHNSQSASVLGRENSIGRSLSPGSVQAGTSNAGSPANSVSAIPGFNSYSSNNNNNMQGFVGTLPQMGGTNNPFGDLFSPSILKSAGLDTYFDEAQNQEGQTGVAIYGMDSGNDTNSGFNRRFQFNSGSSIGDSTSPGGSSTSAWNMNGATNSSCGTSPEPSHDSPAHKDKLAEASKISPSMPFVDQSQNGAKNGFSTSINLNDYINANADYNIPSVGNFDPVLFGDYRDTNDAIVGTGDFNGGFFDDALNQNVFDYASPSNLFGILQSPQPHNASLPAAKPTTKASAPSTNLMAEMDKARDGGDDDYGLPSKAPKKVEGTGKLISCNNIWNQLQSNPDFQDGKFDLDSLCSELRMKARCSDSGVMVDQSHVDAAFQKLGKKDDTGKPYDPPPLTFEQDSWDKVLAKLGAKN